MLKKLEELEHHELLTIIRGLVATLRVVEKRELATYRANSSTRKLVQEALSVVPQ